MNMKSGFAVAIVTLLTVSSVHADEPVSPKLSRADLICAQATSQYVQVPLTNAGLIDQTKVDNEKTDIDLLSKESLGHGYDRRVYRLGIHELGGRSVTVIATSYAGMGECPYRDSPFYVVSREFK